MDNFRFWLSRELKRKNWKQADLARAANLDSAVISNLIHGKRGPGEGTCRAIAQAFDLAPETVFRAAGILDPIPPDQERVENWREILRLLTPEEEAELREIGLLKIKRRQAASRINQARKQPPGDDD